MREKRKHNWVPVQKFHLSSSLTYQIYYFINFLHFNPSLSDYLSFLRDRVFVIDQDSSWLTRRSVPALTRLKKITVSLQFSFIFSILQISSVAIKKEYESYHHALYQYCSWRFDLPSVFVFQSFLLKTAFYIFFWIIIYFL